MSWRPSITAGRGAKASAIVEALAADIERGTLGPGERLPPQRELALALGVDLTTVTRAFNEARRRGLIEASVGRGSFVRASGAARAEPPSTGEATSLDLTMNMPPQPEGARLHERLSRAVAQVLAAPSGRERLAYQDSLGAAADRAAGARWLGARLGPVTAERVVVAGGAQAALYAVLATLLAPGEALCVPDATYPGLRAAAASRQIRLIPIAIDRDGLVPEALERALSDETARALYCVPTIDNPTTATLPEARREHIAAIARRRGAVIIEDDAYGAVPESAPPPFAVLAPELTWHIATLSKCVSPGLRVAYVVVPEGGEPHRLGGELRAVGQMAPPLLAAIASRFVLDGTVDTVAAAIREESTARQTIARDLLGGLDLSAHPQGHHVWLRLPSGWTRGELTFQARRSGLSLVPSDAFAVGPAVEAVRIALGAASDRETLRRGLSMVAALLARGPGASSGVV